MFGAEVGRVKCGEVSGCLGGGMGFVEDINNSLDEKINISFAESGR